MDQLTNNKHKIDTLISNDTSLIQPTQTISNSKRKKKVHCKKRIRCNECNKKRIPLDESHQICHVCYETKIVYNQELSGNKVIDDFIRHTQINVVKKQGKMEFVPYDQFKDIEFIAEGGFSKIYKATWINGPVVSNYSNKHHIRDQNHTVVLKKLNNSKNITSKELNELKVFYDFSVKSLDHFDISEYYGITQDTSTQDIMIIMPYYSKGDLIHYITKDFYNIDWYSKLDHLTEIIDGLSNLHSVNIVHRDLHGGNIFIGSLYDSTYAQVGDFGLSKSATDSADDNSNEKYGIIPYIAPEIFQGQKYTTASDIYSFGMIMWEVMTGRRPFWDRNHDAVLIIEIFDGLRPPIVTNAPEGYIELMKKCWRSDPNQRPGANYIRNKFRTICRNDFISVNEHSKTQIKESPDIGPVTINDSGAIYKSRPLSGMINSAMSIWSSRNQSIDLSNYYQKINTISTDKNEFAENLNDDIYLGQRNKKRN